MASKSISTITHYDGTSRRVHLLWGRLSRRTKTGRCCGCTGVSANRYRLIICVDGGGARWWRWRHNWQWWRGWTHRSTGATQNIFTGWGKRRIKGRGFVGVYGYYCSNRRCSMTDRRGRTPRVDNWLSCSRRLQRWRRSKGRRWPCNRGISLRQYVPRYRNMTGWRDSRRWNRSDWGKRRRRLWK